MGRHRPLAPYIATNPEGKGVTKVAASNGKPSKLPRLVPGAPGKPRARKEVDLPGIGASVVIEAPSVSQWQATEQMDGTDHERSVALCALALVEPEMTGEQLGAAVKDWPMTDWVVLDRAVADLMEITEEALRAAQHEFRASPAR